ncbi:MAG: MtrB/PioB family outer membrane beta-barrel protein [Candidatus Eisenbacteria bacterium]|nr:MtrB/PioB family outer membrane beta-barrel protein [Candidatus Eisenbacteria bacterium]
MTRMHWMRWTLLACLAAVCLFGAAPARAEGDFLTYGSQWWDQTAQEAKYQEYRDIPRGGFLENFLLTRESGRNQFTLFGSNALRSDQSTSARWTNGVRLSLEMGYAETPHQFSFITKSPWYQVRPGVFVLPDSLQGGLQKTPGNYGGVMRDLLNSSPIVPLGFQTNVSKARLRGRPMEGFQLEASATRRVRTGNKAIGIAVPVTGSGPSDGYEMPEPIDQQTLDGELRANYQKRFEKENVGLNIQAIVGMSKFTNYVDRMVFDNPKRLTDSPTAGAAAMQIPLYPDNDVLRGNLMLGLELPHRTLLTAAMGIARTEQNQRFLPYTVNSLLTGAVGTDTNKVNISTLALPDTSLHGKAITKTMDVRLASRLMDQVSATLRYRSYKYENQTPELVFPGVALFDRSWVNEEQGPNLWGHSNQAVGLDVDADPMRQVKLGLSYELRDRKHADRETARDTENWIGAKARIMPLDQYGLVIKARYEHGKRHGHVDEDHMVELPDSVEKGNLRRFDVADRTRNLVGVGASWSVGKYLDMSADFSYTKIEFPANDSTDGKFYGWTGDTATTVTMDAVFHATEQLDIHGGIGVSLHNYGQASHESSPNADPTKRIETDWFVFMKDKNHFAILDATWRGMGDKLTLTGSYEFERTQMPMGELWAGPENSVTRPIGQLPEFFSRRHTLGLEAAYRIAEKCQVGARWAFDEYFIADWQQQDNPYVNPVTGTVNTIFMGNNRFGYYHAHRFAVLVKRDL